MHLSFMAQGAPSCAQPIITYNQKALSFWADGAEGIIFDPKRKAIYKEVNYGFTIKKDKEDQTQ